MARFGFLVFYFHPDRKITENLFTVTENLLRKETFAQHEKDNSEWTASLHRVRSGSQSQRGIRFAYGALLIMHSNSPPSLRLLK